MLRHSKSKKVELLGNVALFSACNQRELQRIASLADELDVDADRVLCKEGKPGGEFFVVASGQAKASLRGRKIATFGPGSFFGEMALLDRGPRTATVTALTPMHLLVVDPASFNALLDEVPTVSRKIIQALSERLRLAEKAPHY